MTPEETEQWNMEKMFFYLPSKMDKAVRAVTEDIISDVPIKSYHYPVLRLIWAKDGITQKEINADVPFDKSRISVIVHELMDMEMVTDTGKGRTSSLHITEKGIDAVNKTRGFTRVALDRIMAAFSDDEKKAVHDFFIKLDAHLDEIINL